MPRVHPHRHRHGRSERAVGTWGREVGSHSAVPRTQTPWSAGKTAEEDGEQTRSAPTKPGASDLTFVGGAPPCAQAARRTASAWSPP